MKLVYKGYRTEIEYSVEDKMYFGILINVGKDLICVGGRTILEFLKYFKESVDDYILMRQELDGGCKV